jgi:hypothetical protein
MKPCGHLSPRLPEPPWSGDYCRVCYLHATDPAYRALWEGVQPADNAHGLPCLFLGPVLAEVHCRCPGQRVHRCELHGPVTLVHCKTCPDYQVP